MTGAAVPPGWPRCSGSPTSPSGIGPFWQLTTGNGVNLDFHDGDIGGDAEITSQHYAFLVTEDEFDAIFGRLVERNIDYYADQRAHRRVRSTTTTVVAAPTSSSPDGHWLEIITRPYGSGGS